MGITLECGHKHKNTHNDVMWCYLCRKCGAYHPVGDVCNKKQYKRMQGAYITIKRQQRIIKQQGKELRELLELKRYITNHKDWKKFYA